MRKATFNTIAAWTIIGILGFLFAAIAGPPCRRLLEWLLTL